MTVRSASELHAALDDAYEEAFRADNNLREMRYLTDDELRSSMRDRLSSEKAAIREAVATERIYVVAGSGVRRIHFYDCPTLRGYMDRDRAWSRWFRGDLEDYRREVAHGDGGPRMPALLDRDAVEELRTYVTCHTCSPTLNHTRKSLADGTIQIANLGGRHVGRAVADLNGSPLGYIERIVTTVDSGGTSVRVETTTHSLSDRNSPIVVVHV